MVVGNGLLGFWSRAGQFKKKYNPAQPQRLKKKSCKGSFEEKKNMEQVLRLSCVTKILGYC